MRLMTLALLLCTGTLFAAEPSKFLKGLEGTYDLSVMKKAGEEAPAELRSSFQIVIKGDALTIAVKGDKESGSKDAVVTVDETKNPISIDLTPKSDASKKMIGIIKADKDEVTICWNDVKDSTDRPKDFTSTKENKHILIVMKKAK
jgi:uncharacterized protein (TIGR03067 family)